MNPYPDENEKVELFPCKFCGKKFIESSLKKHIKHCEENSRLKEEGELKKKNALKDISPSVDRSDNLKQSKELRDAINLKREERKKEGKGIHYIYIYNII